MTHKPKVYAPPKHDYVIWLYTFLLALAIGPGAFVGGMLGGIGILGAPLLLWLTWRHGLPEAGMRLPAKVYLARDYMTLAVAALMVMALLNTLSLWPPQSWNQWIILTSFFLPLAMFPRQQRDLRPAMRRVFPYLFGLALIAALWLAIELHLGGPMLHIVKPADAPLTQYNRGVSYLVLLAFPLLAGCYSLYRGRPMLAYGMIAVLAVALFITGGLAESRAAKLALILGLLVVAAAWYVPKFTAQALAALPAVLCLWPFVVQTLFISCFKGLQHLPDSWRARVEIWDYMSYRIMEHPWLGWGLGTSQQLPFDQPHGARYVFTLVAASHPHNVITQLWAEIGLPGLALGLAFAWLTLRHAYKLDKPLVPFALGAWMAALCLSLVAYNFWADSLFGCFALIGCLFSLLNSPDKSARHFVVLSKRNPKAKARA